MRFSVLSHFPRHHKDIASLSSAHEKLAIGLILIPGRAMRLFVLFCFSLKAFKFSMYFQCQAVSLRWEDSCVSCLALPTTPPPPDLRWLTGENPDPVPLGNCFPTTVLILPLVDAGQGPSTHPLSYLRPAFSSAVSVPFSGGEPQNPLQLTNFPLNSFLSRA